MTTAGWAVLGGLLSLAVLLGWLEIRYMMRDGGLCHFRHLGSSRNRSARGTQPSGMARYTLVGRVTRKLQATDRSQAVQWDVSKKVPDSFKEVAA